MKLYYVLLAEVRSSFDQLYLYSFIANYKITHHLYFAVHDCVPYPHNCCSFLTLFLTPEQIKTKSYFTKSQKHYESYYKLNLCFQIFQAYNAKIHYIQWENLLEVVLFLSTVLFVLDYEPCQRITGWRSVSKQIFFLKYECRKFKTNINIVTFSFKIYRKLRLI